MRGNAGRVAVGEFALWITDPHGKDQVSGELPQRVFTLDENFMVARRSANLCLLRDLTGYRMYGPDLCMMADVTGHTCYVIDFHQHHLIGGTQDDSFSIAADAFARKYARAFRLRWVRTTVVPVFLSGTRLVRNAATSRVGRAFGTKGWPRR